MVVGDDVSVSRDNDSRTCGFLLGSLDLSLLCAAVATSEETAERVAEEIRERVTLHVNGLDLAVLYILDIDH